MLTRENKYAIKMAEQGYDKWYKDKPKNDSGNMHNARILQAECDIQEKIEHNPGDPLVTVDMTEHLDKQNQEMANLLKEHMAKFVEQKNIEIRNYVKD